jgi:hypothetical protein
MLLSAAKASGALKGRLIRPQFSNPNRHNCLPQNM